MVYSGHQFGYYVSQLGDGRASLLGQIINQKGQLSDLVVKGSGLTAFSRAGDGRAVLRSTIREYLASEAMYHLNIPTTRAMAIYGSETPVERETLETAAILVRVAKTHIRFGSFEYFYHTQQYEKQKTLADYTIENHFPDIAEHPEKYNQFMLQIAEKTGALIAQWQAVGFAHGVMNTDNMSIIGETFDFGPFGFLDGFNPSYICNHSDHEGRYSFDNQPQIGHWNCMALAQALSPLFTENISEGISKSYSKSYHQTFYKLMRAKLGLTILEKDDKTLIHSLLNILAKDALDYTNFFRQLSHQKTIDRTTSDAMQIWQTSYFTRLKLEHLTPDQIRTSMLMANPKYILRNHLLQNAIEKSENGDHSEVEKLMLIISKPYDELPEYEDYASDAPSWAKDLEISCSS